MTMHLLGPWYTTTKTNRKTKVKTKQLSKHDAWLLKHGVHPEQIKMKKSVDLNWVKEYNDTLKVDKKDYVSLGVVGNCPKQEQKVYTGGNLLGIATMHKSNMVPIFADNKQAAADIAKMRR